MPLFALHDSDPAERSRSGARPVAESEARRLNSRGFGIFWTPNTFRDTRRATNLERIRYWFVELDGGSKAEQWKRLQKCSLLPNVVVESKNGYHAYWRARDATPENWKCIVRWGLVPALQGDPKSTDPVRLLRAPGFNHVKDPERPFPVEIVYRDSHDWLEAQMLRKFPSQEPERPKPRELEPGGGSFWERVARLDGREALLKLNGHWLVRGERFHLSEQPNGNANIWRTDDYYDTGCFIDQDGRLGNVQDGASIAAWCAWYKWPWADVANGLRELFPELGDDHEAK